MADFVMRFSTTLLTPADEPERGWCVSCNLPSLFLWHMVFESKDRMLNDGITTLAKCADCGAEQWT